MPTEGMTHGEPAVLDLAAVNSTMAGLVGGKAANLGEMLSAGFHVPDGFCVTTSAYREILAHDAQAGLDALTAADSGRLVEVAERFRDHVLRAPIPAPLEDAVLLAYQELSGRNPADVAVRSSSTAEDLPDASFAGQYDTYLNVRGADEVIANLRKCWASLWSERATQYGAAHHTGGELPVIAVIVQRMVDAQCAGVLYTANPVTGNRTEVLVEATPGLGEAVVSGTVTPDHYRLAADGQVVEGPDDGCLSAAQLAELRALGQSLEKHFGAPQDVEWAIDRDGELWITQSRPITTLFPVPQPGDQSLHAYWSVNVYQGISQPFTPMGAYMVRQRQRGMQHYMGTLGFSSEIIDVDGWLYWDITDGVRSPAKRPKMAAFVDSLAAPTGQIVTQLGEDPRFPSVPSGSAQDAPPAKRKRRWERLVPALLWPNVSRERVFRGAERQLSRFTGPAKATARQRLEFVKSVCRDVCQIEANLPRDANTAGGLAQQYATNLLRGYATATEITTVFGGVPHNPTTEMDLQLWRLARRVREDAEACRLLVETAPDELAAKQLAGALPAVVQSGVASFLASYGCRATAEIDFGVPRWSDDPEPIFVMLANFLRASGQEQDAEQRFASAAAAAEAKIDELVRRIPLSRLPRRWLARFLLRRSRALRGLREFPKLCLMRGFQALRTQLLAVGADLAAANVLSRAEDVMFLDLTEVDAALDGQDFRAVVAERQAVYDRERRRPRVPSILLSDGTAPEVNAAGSASGSSLTGLAAAAGRVTGVARVVFDPNDAHVEPGEILVASTTDPGWTPLFLTAAALVTETGGMISHGTTIAREYGIPAVVGVSNATRLIRTGQVITVDGSAGVVSSDEPLVQAEPVGR
ncbi:PEP/pyruvate-binding domain-containing protein [Goodfellowiella coeruleoviolacea]|uniref:Pyruvate, water dikinase n=1 Tax=Goodfellowiella coeruleoviolacea TaxID=334858 RepID=A0AAE3G8N3_9PSEU|nr:PEP/pyruvate-binding domain-containing protein [Goodfellowiella coeruleoviolacea]MCP2163308.1 pyruvate, water dikinase [Goodfellowiella coeruleoviolacea]